MPTTDPTAIPDFAQEAVLAFEDTMANVHKAQMTQINRANQGELFLLKELYFRKEATNPSQLSAAMQSSMARVSSLLKTLEGKGQIERRTDRQDRRNVQVKITQEGRQRIRLELGQMRRDLGGVFAAMGPQDSQDFLRLFTRFSDLVKIHIAHEDPLAKP